MNHRTVFNKKKLLSAYKGIIKTKETQITCKYVQVLILNEF